MYIHELQICPCFNAGDKKSKAPASTTCDYRLLRYTFKLLQKQYSRCLRIHVSNFGHFWNDQNIKNKTSLKSIQ